MTRTAFPEQGVYVILSGECRPDLPLLEQARQAIAGGAAVIQLREKHLSRADLLAPGRELAALCRAHGVVFIVNDDPELAVQVDADGVHLGQEDLAGRDLPAVRRLVGDRFIGLSSHTKAQFIAAQETDVDYVAFGPLYPTPAKPYHVGLAALPVIVAAARKPAVFIGGINRQNAGELIARGCRNLAVIRDIIQADDIAGAVREFRDLLAAGRQ